MASSDSPIVNELPSLSTSLLDRVQQMQPEAWARMVQVFSPIVYRWARQAGLDAADAADVVQDVFVALAKNISRFQRSKQKASFRSWLATITRNRIRDCFRKQRLHPPGFGGTEALQRFHEIADHAIEEDELPVQDGSDWIEQSISVANLEGKISQRVLSIVKSECDTKTWKAFWLTTVNGDAAADVAERLQMNVASVYQAKSRILRRLRKRMDEIP